MPAGKHDIYIEQGATWSLPLIWQTAEGEPKDVTGYTARMHLRKRATDTTYALELTTENGRITLGGADGKITLLIAAVDTATLALRTGVYDLELVNQDGVVIRLLEGTAKISREVTREGALYDE